ncbi:hypothetical protein ACFL1H_01605 [Nanoarchaeota archaeon]
MKLKLLTAFGTALILGGCGGGGGGVTPTPDEETEQTVRQYQEKSIENYAEQNEIFYVGKINREGIEHQIGLEYMIRDKSELKQYLNDSEKSDFLDLITDKQPVTLQNPELTATYPAQINISNNNIGVYVDIVNAQTNIIETRLYPLIEDGNPNNRTFQIERFKQILPDLMQDDEEAEDIFSL